MNIDELNENFKLLDNWEDKYRYIIDLGEKLPKLDENYKIEKWQVSGCQSQVWLVPSYQNGKLVFLGDSDAMIVRGLIAIVSILFNDKSPKEILSINALDAFSLLGLEEHLSPSRRNGLEAMIEKIRSYAQPLI